MPVVLYRALSIARLALKLDKLIRALTVARTSGSLSSEDTTFDNLEKRKPPELDKCGLHGETTDAFMEIPHASRLHVRNGFLMIKLSSN